MNTQLTTLPAYKNLNLYWGDLHNHCAVGYGHGSLDDSFQNAQLQLDFAAVTVHAHWPDIPVEEERLADLVAYHQTGFKKARDAWSMVQDTVAANHDPGRFVTFLGFEWHSRKYGDHNIYFNGASGEILRDDSLEGVRRNDSPRAKQRRRCAADSTSYWVQSWVSRH